VHARARELQRDGLVVAGGHRDHRRVDALVDERRDGLEHGQAARDAVRVALRVGDGDEPHAVELTGDADVVAAHHAEADDADAQLRHHAPAFARAFTAATTRSRSPSDSDGCTGSDSTSRAARSVSGRSISRPNDGSRWFGFG
jgi:hypothetical protein